MTAATLPRLVALSGAAGSGKTTAADYLIEHYGYHRIKFAGPLKDMLYAIGLTHGEVEGTSKQFPSDLLCGQCCHWQGKFAACCFPCCWVVSLDLCILFAADFAQCDDYKFTCCFAVYDLVDCEHFNLRLVEPRLLFRCRDNTANIAVSIEEGEYVNTAPVIFLNNIYKI